MAQQKTSEFKYSDIADFNIVVNEYIKTIPDYSLYTYIKKLVEGYDEPPSMGMALAIDGGFDCDKEILDLITKIDNYAFDVWFLDRFMFNLQLSYYNVNMIGLEINFTQNTGFKEWCDRFDTIFTRNSKKEKSIRNVIVPFQKTFLERLWNPHTKIGRFYGEMKRDELEWNVI